MKKIAALFVLAMFPAALSAQTMALSQLDGIEAVKAADIVQVAVPMAPEASRDKGPLVLPDPRTAKTHVVIPAGGSRKVQAGAALAGRWLGQGEWTYQGSGAHCYMSMEFEEGTDYLFRKSGYFDCSVVGLDIEPARFVKKGTQLLDQNGLAAGSYENNVITLNEVYNDNVDVTTVIRVDGLHFDYSEIWREKDGSELYNIRGRLFTGG